MFISYDSLFDTIHMKVINKKLVPMVHLNLKTTDSLKKSPLEVKRASKSW